MKPLSRTQLAQVVASHLPQNSFVNLGIGAPTTVGDFVPASRGVMLHSENGILNVGPRPAAGEEDHDLINAGKAPITLGVGGSYFDTSLSFAMMRGGHWTSPSSAPSRFPSAAISPTGQPAPTLARHLLSVARLTSRWAPSRSG